MDQNWKEVPGYEGIYTISDNGSVMRTGAAQSTKPGRLVKPSTNDRGYRTVVLSKGCRLKQFRIHRLVAAAFLGAAPDGRPEVNHKDGDKANNSISNLEYVSRSQNMLHAFRVLGIQRLRTADGKYA